jgi:hypothetical protein
MSWFRRSWQGWPWLNQEIAGRGRVAPSDLLARRWQCDHIA